VAGLRPPGPAVTAPQLACLRLEGAPEDGAAKGRLVALLQRFSPRVADVASDPRLFVLDASGLVGLYPDHQAWAQALLAAVGQEAAAARLVVGYDRFNVLLLAHLAAPQPLQLIFCPETERQAVHTLPLAAAPLGPKVIEVAQELGLRTLGCLLRLPQGEVAQILGPEALSLHRLGRDAGSLPLGPLPLPEPCAVEAALEPPDHDSTRLLFVCKTLLPALLEQAHARRCVVAAIDVTLVQEAPHTLRRRPPERATRRVEAGRGGRAEAPWLQLIRLALEAWPLPRAVQAVVLTAQLRAPEGHQLQLWPDAAARDPAQTSAAIGQLRARFGDGAVTCAELLGAHRPEGRFQFVPAHRLAVLAPKAVGPRSAAHREVPAGTPPLMRRLWPTPQPLPKALVPLRRPAPPWSAPAEGPLLRPLPPGGEPGPCGPFVLSHGWWQAPCDRDYYYLPGPGGAWLWAYFDRQARLWRLQGVVD